MQVPVCPQGPRSALACHLKTHGWSWDEPLLLEVIQCLGAEDISVPRDLLGVKAADISGASDWPADVQNFVQCLCQVRLPMEASQFWPCPYLVHCCIFIVRWPQAQPEIQHKQNKSIQVYTWPCLRHSFLRLLDMPPRRRSTCKSASEDV